MPDPVSWSTNTDWTSAQSTDNVEISSGTFALPQYPATVDDFESQSLTPYGGDTTTFSIASNNVQNGTYSLEETGSSSGVAIASTSGLNAYPTYPQKFRCWLAPAENEGIGVAFALLNEDGTGGGNSGYIVTIDYGQRVGTSEKHAAELLKFDGTGDAGGWGNKTHLGQIADAEQELFTQGNWYEVVVDWGYSNYGEITAEIYDTGGTQVGATARASDETHISQSGIGFLSSSGNDVNYADYYRLTA